MNSKITSQRFSPIENEVEEYDLLRTLLTHTEDYVYFKDRESRFLLTNMATAKIMGAKSPQDLVNKTDFDFYPKDLATRYYEDEQKIVRSGLAIVNFEEPGIDSNGHIRCFLTTKVPIKNKHGEVIGLVGIGKDITQRKKAEEILKRDKETLEKLATERAKEIVEIQVELEKSKRLSDIGTLAAMVAHELRQPLAAIKMALVHIKRKVKNAILDSYLEIIDKKVLDSDQIINNLLFYSRIKPPHLESHSLNAVIKECADVLLSRTEKTITLTNHFESIKDVEIQMDPLQMREVFHNVLNNAYDAIEDQKGVIEISCEDDEENLRVCVQDNGAGMSAEELEKVFDAFYTTKAKGTGLGLSVCYQIVTMHGGHIKMDSAVGQGTRVTIILPKKA